MHTDRNIIHFLTNNLLLGLLLYNFLGPDEHRPPMDTPPDERHIDVGKCVYHRMGSVCRMISPSPLPIPLTGIANNNKFELMGAADVPINQSMQINHGETYNCTLDKTIHNDTQVWKGQYTIEQHGLSGQDYNMRATFNIEMHMKQSDM